jgi:hypothetical protein
LYRIAEHEAEPAEAIEAARHLPRCTACKILLARERRLAALLEHELADLSVDDAFVRDVMDTLPASPPRPAAQIRVLRGMKLACLAGLLLLYGASVAPHLPAPSPSGWFPAPAVDLDAPVEPAAPALGVAALALRVVGALAPVLSEVPRLGELSVGTGLALGFALPLAVVGLGVLGAALAARLATPTAGRASRAS